jgi:outer membrane usher protein
MFARLILAVCQRFLALAIFAVLCPGIALAQSQTPTATDKNKQQLLPLDVSINGAKPSSWTLLEREGTLYAPADAFIEWRLKRDPAAKPISYLGQQWYALTSIPGFTARMNFADQSVDLGFSPNAFAETRLNAESSDTGQLTKPESALFLNYDLNLTQTSDQVSSTRDLGALTEFGFSNRWGVLTSSFVARGLASNNPAQPASVRRLETVFTRDFPDNSLTLRLGDTTTRPGSWGRQVYFGGLQIGRNFGLKPGLTTRPIPILSGVSTAPSTVDLYINDTLRQTSQVPAGPFSIDNFPLLTGSGQARIVVRDLLGRETVLLQDFFSHSSLLEQGLTDWSVEAGAVRRNLGVLNADYGERFVSGLFRYGINKELTVETRAEASKQIRGAGLGLTHALPAQMLGQFSAAASTAESVGTGTHWQLGLEKSTLHHSITVRGEGGTRAYREIGQEKDSLPVRRQWSASYTYMSDRLGSFGLAYARIDSYEAPTLQTYSANYSVKVGERSSLTVNAVRVSDASGKSSGTSFGVNLMVPLQNQITVASNVSHRGLQTDGSVTAAQGLTGETGWSWRSVAGRRSGSPYAEGGLYFQGTKGSASADLSVSRQQRSLRLGSQGGVIVMDGQVFASRPVQDSFALVEVPGYANVGIGAQGRTTGKTDSSGTALVTGLVSYQINSIRLDPSELPISAELDSIEQIVTPPARSGVLVKFPVRTGRGALIKFELDDGEPVPPGAELELVGDTHEFFVARRGEAFVTGLQAKNVVRLKWADKTCSVDVDLPPGSPDEIARVGPLKCSGVKR